MKVMKRVVTSLVLFVFFSLHSPRGFPQQILKGVELDLGFNSGEEINTTAFSADGRILAIGFFYRQRPELNNGFLLYDLQKNQIILKVQESLTIVETISFTSDNQYFFTGNDGGHGFIRKFPSGEILQTIKAPEYEPVVSGPFPRFVSSDFSTDDKQLITGDERGYIQLWDVESGKELKRLWNSQWTGLEKVEFFGDNKNIVLQRYVGGTFITSTAEDSKNIRISGWPRIKIHRNRKWAMTMDSGSNHDFVKLKYWDIEGKVVQSFPEMPKNAEYFVIQEDGLLVAEIGPGVDAITIIDPPKKSRAAKLESTSTALPNGVRFFPDGSKLLVPNKTQVKVFDLSGLSSSIRQSEIHETEK